MRRMCTDAQAGHTSTQHREGAHPQICMQREAHPSASWSEIDHSEIVARRTPGKALARCLEGLWWGRMRITTVTYFGANPHQSTLRAHHAAERWTAARQRPRGRANNRQRPSRAYHTACVARQRPRGHATRPQGGGSSPGGGTPWGAHPSAGQRAQGRVITFMGSLRLVMAAKRGTGVITSRASHNVSATSA